MNKILSLIAPALFMINLSQAMAQDDSPAGERKPVTADVKYQNEIKALAKKPVIVTAFKTIMDLEPETHSNLITLTEIPAPPFKEQQRAAKFIDMMKSIGADSIWIDGVGNVIAYKKGKSGKKTIVLEAHLDTVFPEGTDVKVKYKGDTLMAPGIGDDTRGLAVVLAVMKAMKNSKLKTDADILFVGAVGEEGLGDLRGVKELFKNQSRKIDSYIAIDGGGIGGITSGAVGSHRYHITFKGPGGHSYGAFGLVNPHHAAARAVYYFSNDADGYTRTGAKTTYNVGVIGGGTSVNAIPYESWMEVDMRSESPDRLAGIDSLLQAAVKKAVSEENGRKRLGADITASVELVGDRPTGIQQSSIPLIQKAVAAASYLGASPRLAISSTNSNIPISKGIPAVTIGRGGVGGGGHSLNEWWINDKGYLAIQHALLVLVAEAGLSD